MKEKKMDYFPLAQIKTATINKNFFFSLKIKKKNEYRPHFPFSLHLIKLKKNLTNLSFIVVCQNLIGILN